MNADDLIQNVYTHFKIAYQQFASDASGTEVVAFETIGFSPGCSALTGNNIAAVALETVSEVCDELPKVEGGVYVHTMRTISGTYGIMLDAAEASSAASLGAFAPLKSQAQEAYKVTLGSYLGPTEYHPTYATPADWYDLSNAGNWSSYSSDSSAPAPTPPAPAAPGVHMNWQVLPENLRSRAWQRPEPIGIRREVFDVSSRPVSPILTRTLPFERERLTPQLAVSAAASIEKANIETAEITRPMLGLSALSDITTLAAQTQARPVETPSLKIAFDYCIVQLRRPWLSGDLLATPGWYVAGARGGDYASGGTPAMGAFAAIPRAFIAIKSLSISGMFSAADTAASASSAALGPFALKNSQESGAVGNSGVQIIAWVCSLQPQLPPDSDPALPPVVVATPPPGTLDGQVSTGTQSTVGAPGTSDSSGSAGSAGSGTSTADSAGAPATQGKPGGQNGTGTSVGTDTPAATATQSATDAPIAQAAQTTSITQAAAPPS